VQQSASTEQAPSGGAHVALRQVQLAAPGKNSMHPQIPEQQSELISQRMLGARQRADRHVPFSQMPVQHWDGFVQPTPAGRHAHFVLPLALTTW
jgi:hypothetical protein